MSKEYTNLRDLIHDMRSPLAALTLAIELFEKEKLGPLNPKQHDMAQSMKQSVEKLTLMLTQYKHS
jgi:signal transduction histidine kinase